MGGAVKASAEPDTRLVASATEWSCGLACLESIARERGAAFDQAAVIERFRDRYPLWKDKPGACGLHIRVLGRDHWLIEWELLDLARELGLAAGTVLLRDPSAIAAHRAAGLPVLALTRRSVEGGAVIELNHAVRVVGCGDDGPGLMDPGRRLGPRIIRVPWKGFLDLEPLVFGLLGT